MNFKKFMLGLLGMAVMVASCTPGESVNDPNPNTPPEPITEYVQLNLFSGCGLTTTTEDVDMTRASWDDASGSGNMALKWESVAFDSEKTNELSLIISDGVAPIMSKTDETSDEEFTYSGMAVIPHEEDVHHADFQTVQYYDTEDLKAATYCCAVAGEAIVIEEEENGQHLCFLEMPSKFTQTVSQDPSFLSGSMYMYATTTYKEGRTTLNFNYVPAVFRFVVTNLKNSAINLQELSLSLPDEDIAAGATVASKSSDLTFNWASGQTDLAFDESGHTKVTVFTEGDALLENGESYVAYSLVMPLADDNALNGKLLQFSVKSDDEEQVAFKLDGSKLPAINGTNTYNWVSGKSYTIKINIREDGTATGEILEDNTINVSSEASGSYTLVYEGADGQPLADYAQICRLNVKPTASYVDFIDVNVAPRAAKTIGVYSTTGERQGTIELADFRPDYNKEPLYSFGLLSDVHIGRSGANVDTDFERALNFFNDKGVLHTCICGDITQDGTEAQLAKYEEIALKSATPVLTTSGNHDATTSGINAKRWEEYTGQPLVFEHSVEKNGKVDHYLFFGMSVWNFSQAYSIQSMAWLESKLEEYRNERCFIITHLFFPDRAGNLNGIYPKGNWLSGAQLSKLQKLCDRYLNTLWFSGHSHWEWQLQKYQDRANIYRKYEGFTPASGWCVHVPSCGVPITSNGTSREDNASGSEGAIVEVYEDHVDLLGIDFKSGKYLPIATYRLETALKEIEALDKEDEGGNTPAETHYLKASDFVENTGKTLGASVKDVDGMPNYVEVTFTKKNQGFYVSNSTFTAGSSWVEIIFEDVQATCNGVKIDVPAGVGFYSGSYHMTTTDAAQVFHKEGGVYDGCQFQTSNSKYGDGPLPLTLRMKIQMIFHED
ncbi:MAG: metallophosphoesterase [Rikenellaceae bacterium]|nr:metallophosphoesterase [Rikenellaceae bacterium]